MAAKRAAERDIQIPPCEDPERRARLEGDTLAWLAHYMADRYYNPWTRDQIDMVSAIETAAIVGGDQAVAAPRGNGKTALAEGVALKLILTGRIRFPLIAAATGHDADQILSNIKLEVEGNDRLMADYPEVCFPIRAMNGANQKANSQTVNGKRTRLRWTGDRVIFPTVDGSKASGAIIMTRGMDSAIRGVRHGNLRPDMVIIDDAETRESVKSEVQTTQRELIIENDLAGLGGPGRTLARVLLCTIMNRRCIAWKYTDPEQKPSWQGRRYRWVDALPTRMDLWEEYIARRAADQRAGDKTGRGAHAYYIEHRQEMDAGASVACEHRFIASILPDETQQESSGLEAFFNIVADRGWDAANSEYQSDPPEESGPTDSGLDEHIVAGRIDHRERRRVPAGAQIITAAIDLGKYECHWVIAAWMPGAMGHIIDYGVQKVHGTSTENKAPEPQILAALHEWRHSLTTNPLVDDNGVEIIPAAVMIDAGNWQDVPYEFVRAVGAPYRASKGFGSGHRQTPFRGDQKETATRKPGDRWYAGLQSNGLWLWGFDADHWKRWVHERFATPPGSPGSLAIFGEDEKEHRTFAEHITAETWQEQFTEGKGTKAAWYRRRPANHYLDATTMAAVAASTCGWSIVRNRVAEHVQAQKPVSAKEWRRKHKQGGRKR